MQLSASQPMLRRVSLTALIDVVFILLFFFMLASRPLDWRSIEVDLTAALQRGDSASAAQANSRAVLVLPQGRIHDGRKERDLSDLLDELSEDASLVLVPAPGTSSQKLFDAIEQCRAAGRPSSVAALPEP